MTTLTVGPGGEVRLPDTVRERYGLAPDTPVRLVETPGGILLVPQSSAPMSPELTTELAAWQALADEAWQDFPYEDTAP